MGCIIDRDRRDSYNRINGCGVKILLDVTNFKWAWFGITAFPYYSFVSQLLVNKRFLRSLNINVEVPLSLWLWLIIIINSLFQWILLGCVLLLVQTAFLTNDFRKYVMCIYTSIYFVMIIPNSNNSSGLGIRVSVESQLGLKK